MRLFNQREVGLPTDVMMETITKTLFDNICHGLFNTHKLLFSFSLAAKILRKRAVVSEAEWSLLLRGVIMDGKIKRTPNPDKKLISDTAWRFVLNLEPLSPNFEGLAELITKNIDEWQLWLQSKEPQENPLPCGLSDRLTNFQKMLLFKAFREEKIGLLIHEFVEETLGRDFANPLPGQIEDVYRDSDARTPIIFVLTQGADPAGALIRFAKKIRGENLEEQVYIISLG